MAEAGIPRIQSPRDGAAVDGLACTLTWNSVPDSTYRIQVSANDRFDALLVDAEAGDATALTLYGLLPRDGRRLHWRVAASRSGSGDSWSEPSWFLAADVEDRPPVPPKPAEPPAVARTPAATSAPVAGPVPPYLEATTGVNEILFALAVLVLTVVLLLIAAF